MADLGKYGMGTERSFGDWQEYSGFNYKAGTLDADWGEWGRQGGDCLARGNRAPSGRGQRMGHYIEAGGDFERAAKALLTDGWTVPYVAVSDPPKIGVKCKYTFGVRLVAGAGCWEQVWEPRLEVRAGRYGVLGSLSIFVVFGPPPMG